ncbi:MAG: response regulator, partial [Anaerolineae bacterium]|nr:response regulator [Anaerolineae bacterium]
MDKYGKIGKDFLTGWDVLVVDDQDDALQLIEDILSEYGAKVHLAHNGAEGLEVARQIMPKFIISDIAMPVMDGWEMADKLKSDPHLQHIPIIALTAYSDAEDRKMAMSKGFHNY